MALREFSRLSSRLLAHLGEQAVLRGNQPCRANIEHGVEFADVNDQAIFEKSVATIEKVYRPEKGDTLDVAGGGRFILDRLLKDNGYNRAFILRGR